MLSTSINVVHFHNGSGGGVLSVIKNLIKISRNPLIKNHIVYTINRLEKENYLAEEIEGLVSQKIFYYNPKNNFYFTCRQLSKLLPDEKAIIVAHDWLELGMVSNLGLQNPLVHYVHGAYGYYYDLATKHSPWIDNFLVVADHIRNELIHRLPKREKDLYYFRFPMPEIDCSESLTSKTFNITYAGRCEEAKGFALLPKIESELQKRGILVNWHIVGEGSLDSNKQILWRDDQKSKVKFYGLLSNTDLIKVLRSSHIIILPSEAEGMPLSIIEAMKLGVIPLVNDIEGGIQELVINDVTGYKVRNNDIVKYADLIEMLTHSKDKVTLLRDAVKKHINTLFYSFENIELIESLFLQIKVNPNKKATKLYGSYLDKKYIPNSITIYIRRCLSHIQKFS